MQKIKVALLSAGLGNVARGFEISAANWFTALKVQPTLDVQLFTGGRYENSSRVWNINRNSKLSKYLRRLKLIHDGCRLEQITFSAGFLYYLFTTRPDIIWTQEISLANALLKYKKGFNFKYKIIFCDGAPVGYSIAKKFDFIVLLHEFAYNDAVREEGTDKRLALIPHLSLEPITKQPKRESRKTFNIPQDKFVVICVAAWNMHHKRIDYLLKEFSCLDKEKFLLLLCGQEEAETPALRNLASTLNIDIRWMTLQQKELSKAYTASDLFVLPSLNEGLGAVIIEAALHRLPVVCHPHDGAKYILGEEYKGLTDLSIKGGLSRKINDHFLNNNLEKTGEETFETVYRTFNSETLITRFKNFIEYAAKN